MYGVFEAVRVVKQMDEPEAGRNIMAEEVSAQRNVLSCNGKDPFVRNDNAVDRTKDHKQAAMLERLSALEDERRKLLAARRADSAALANPLESVQAFHEEFAKRRVLVECGLSDLHHRKFEAERAILQAEIDRVTAEVVRMEKLLAGACYYLAPYDVQASQVGISKLKDEISSTTAEVLPKKKFSFRNKTKTGELGEEKQKAFPAAARQGRHNDEKVAPDSHNVESIQDLQHCTVVKDTSMFSRKDVALFNLNHCKVFLRGSLGALYIHRIKDCQILVGPVMGSILLEEVDGSILVLASHQIRIHSTSNSDFYLRVRSRPIVEHTSKVRFAPYAFHYRGLQNELSVANLSEENGMWEKVDDFRWLRATPSPNWSIIPPDQRISAMDVPEVDN